MELGNQTVPRNALFLPHTCTQFNETENIISVFMKSRKKRLPGWKSNPVPSIIS